ncbi:glycosyltransferase family 4 protein [Roseivirga sp.]|uniref:glycosyltransferase family 4 protein n=1 Tax=Roseivirga sp. TaxID=1964215 RepID=UPI003B8C0DCF
MVSKTGYSHKIKVFLGAYINQTNAQNLNCRVLAECLNKKQFDVLTLSLNHGNLGEVKIPGVKVFHCKKPVRLFQTLGYLWGIYKADVAYLPRGNNYELQRFLVRLFKRKSFKTVENIIDEESLSTALSVLGTRKRVLENYSFSSRSYSITSFMKSYNLSSVGLKTEDKILPPPIDTTSFSEIRTVKKKLKDLLFIGNAMKRKRVRDFVELAKDFPELNFHIVGKGGEDHLFKELEIKKIMNIVYHGLLNHDELKSLMGNIDFHVLPSRSEGFPKGIIECAAAGIPSLVYHDYGAEEWIDTGKNGFVCRTLEEMKSVIKSMLDDSLKLSVTSDGAIKLANKYSAEYVVSLYADEINAIYQSRLS